MISTGNAFNPASAYPDWVEAETSSVYGSIFSQIHDFDRFSLPNTATMAFRGLMQYTIILVALHSTMIIISAFKDRIKLTLI
jgi:hypothetical protein